MKQTVLIGVLLLLLLIAKTSYCKQCWLDPMEDCSSHFIPTWKLNLVPGNTLGIQIYPALQHTSYTHKKICYFKFCGEMAKRAYIPYSMAKLPSFPQMFSLNASVSLFSTNPALLAFPANL